MLNFPIPRSGIIGKEFFECGLEDFQQAAYFIRGLPYGRTSNRKDFLLVLREGKGTCSSKHALLAKLAEESGVPVDLMLGLFELSGENIPQARVVLEKYGIPSIPELHTYLCYRSERMDFTGLRQPITPRLSFLHEEKIAPEQVESYKIERHKELMSDWLSHSSLRERFTLDMLWQIREECLTARVGLKAGA